MTCAACQVTLPVVRSVIDRADALADAVEAWREAKRWAEDNPRLMLSSTRTTEEAAEIMRNYFDHEQLAFDALDVYRAGPPPAYTTDDGRPMCPSCFWKAASA